MIAPYLTSDALVALPGIRHGFFGRKGGVSQGLYGSLNAGLGSGDDPVAVGENRARICRALGAEPGQLSTLYQIHSREVVTLTAPLSESERPQADALVTKIPGLILGALSADCVPVLFADPSAGVIGAAHAGWKGALSGITDATVKAMEALGATRGNIIAAVGPAIGWQSYEVDLAFMQRFLDDDAANAVHFRPGVSDEKRLFDVKGYVAGRLARSGIARVGMLANDTYREAEDFYSYRRATHQGETDYGRQVSCIMLEG